MRILPLNKLDFMQTLDIIFKKTLLPGLLIFFLFTANVSETVASTFSPKQYFQKGFQSLLNSAPKEPSSGQNNDSTTNEIKKGRKKITKKNTSKSSKKKNLTQRVPQPIIKNPPASRSQNTGGGSSSGSSSQQNKTGNSGTQNTPPSPAPQNNPQKENRGSQVSPNERKTFLITDFQAPSLEGWYHFTYGTAIEQSGAHSFCRMKKNTYNRCGEAAKIREKDIGLLAKNFDGIEITVVNIGTSEEIFNPYIFFSWYDSEASYALVSGYPAVGTTDRVSLGSLSAGETKTFSIPWNAISIDGFDFTQDLFGGVSFLSLGPIELGLKKISLYGTKTDIPDRLTTVHSGGYMIYQRARNEQRFRYDTFDGTRWGEPFADQTLQAGDRIEVYGVINAGTIVGNYHGTESQPITLIGMTEDAAFDGKNATRKAQNGGLITLYGNHWVIKDLAFRNCGIPYGGDENASAFHTTTQHTVFSNLKVSNCGDGFLFSPNSKNNIIENSDIFNNGYFQSGQTHNIYLAGEGHIVRNNRIHHSGGQNLKNRGWNTLVEGNLIWNAGNFDVDYPGSAENPGNTTSIFRGNTVIKSSYSDNSGQFFTFFEDNLNLNIPGRLLVVNNTFIGPSNTSLFRVGKNKNLSAYNNVVVGVKNIQYQGNTDKENGTLAGSHNWLLSDSRFHGRLENSLLGTNPGLERKNQAYVPTLISALINVGKNDALELPLYEYAWPNMMKTRPFDGNIDIGAFEYENREANNPTPIHPPICTPQWECSPFGSCTEGKQTRQCTDINQCGNYNGIPVLEQECIFEPDPDEDEDCQEIPQTIWLTKTVPDDTVWGIEQSGMLSRYPQFGYNGNDNPINEERRYNLTFQNLLSAIERGKLFEKAELTLHFYNQYDSATLEIFLLNEEWEGSGHASWNHRQGAPDATKNFMPSSLPLLPWTTAGGTVDAGKTIIFNINNPGREYHLVQKIEITPFVQEWISGKPNYGIQIRTKEGNVTDLFGVDYWSRGEYLGPSLALTLGCQGG
jgi:hypothetical protein